MLCSICLYWALPQWYASSRSVDIMPGHWHDMPLRASASVAAAAAAAIAAASLCYDPHLVRYRILFFSNVVNILQWRSFQMLPLDIYIFNGGNVV